MKNTDIYDRINSRIIDLLKQQLEGWQQTWINIKVETFAHNPHTKHFYSLLNNLLMHYALHFKKGYYLNRWITFLQANELGAKITRGSKSDIIAFTSSIYVDDNAKNVTKQAEAMLSAGIAIPRSWKKINFLKGYNVFNVADVEGLPDAYTAIAEKPVNKFNRIEKAEEIIKSTGANLQQTATNAAYYMPLMDIIKIPNGWQFNTPESFYGTLFHELGHWTGHESRLNRKQSTKQEDYAFEELVAELTAAYCCAKLDIESPITQNAAYLKSWLHGLSDDMKFFTLAAGQAQKAADFIFNPESNEERAAA